MKKIFIVIGAAVAAAAVVGCVCYLRSKSLKDRMNSIMAENIECQDCDGMSDND